MKTPYQVYRLEDFTSEQIDRAADDPGGYSTALVFSTKYDPPSLLLSLGPRSEALDKKYFGLHHDLPPEAIAAASARNAELGARRPCPVDRTDPIQPAV